MKNKFLYIICLLLVMWAISCKKNDDKGAPQPNVDKVKISSMLEHMNLFSGYLSGVEGVSADRPFAKIAGVHTFNQSGFAPTPIDGVIPVEISKTDNYVVYEYNSASSTDYKGKMWIGIGLSSEEDMEITYFDYKDNTKKDDNGNVIDNLTNGSFKFSGSGNGAMIINSNLTVAVAGEPTYTLKCKNLAYKITESGTETNGVMELILGKEKYNYEYVKVIDLFNCDFASSGTLNVSTLNSGTITNRAYKINFGNSTCDNKITVKSNGATEEISLVGPLER